jgi:IS30 family transposase
VKSINIRCGVSQRKLAEHFNVYQSTISRNLGRRTSVAIRKRTKAPKMDNIVQEKNQEEIVADYIK